MKIKTLLSISLILLVFGNCFAQKKSKEPKKEKLPTYVPSFPPPDYLLKEKTYYFRGERNGLKMDLELKRKTAQEIRYKLSILFPNNQKFKEKGMVYMTFAYDMGKEERYQESTGQMKSCINFFPRKENGLIICIGDDNDEISDNLSKLFVQVTLHRNNYPPIDLEETPELFELEFKP